MRLQGKTAIVSGSASGIGKAIALRFAQEGAEVFCSGVSGGCQNTAREIQEAGGRAAWAQADISKLPDIDKMVAAAVAAFGKIDILVNNAGVYMSAPILEVTEKDWDTQLDVMLKGTFFTVQRVLPYMLKQGKGKIINMASTFGVIGFYDCSAYCAAKGGIVNLTRQLAFDLAPKKINVNAIGPGTTDTPLMKPDLDNPERAKLYLDRLPYGRVARPEEIAAAAVYLASDEADFVNGHTLFVDGGWLTQ